MKKLLKRTLFKKIFFIIFFAFLIVLITFTYITFEMQKQSEFDYLREQINDWQTVKNIQEELGVENNLDYKSAIKELDKLNEYERINKEDIAVIRRNLKERDDIVRRNEIMFSTFNGKNKDYIQIGENQYSLDVLNQKQKESLLEYFINHLNDKKTCIEYEIENNQIIYLKWANETFGKIKKQFQKTSMYEFCLLNHITYSDLLKDTLVVVDIDDIKEAIRQIDFYIGENGIYSTRSIKVGKQTFIITMGYFGGDYDPHNSLTDDRDFLNIVTIGVIDHFDEYIFMQCMQQNKWIYMTALFVLIFVSWCLSTIITYPISKIQQSALKIANNDFSEEIKMKSKDELGSLAESINVMRIQLKQTIEQLNQEIEHVKELELLRKDFVNQFTHEMKTPLGIINGYSELIEEAENEEEVKKYLDVINRETSRVNQLIQSMLKLSRLEAGKVELIKEKIDLEDLVTEIIDEYEILLMKKNIKVSIDTQNVMINGDMKQLKIVIQNFLSNAIRHVNENGSIIIRINQGLSIFNEGENIKEGQIEKIWYTFVTHHQEGSGLGLAICKSILELHGYQYGVVNQENGVEFYFHVK